MAAVAPVLSTPAFLDEPLARAVEPDFVDPAVLGREIAEQNLLLARSPEIPQTVRLFVEELADEISALPAEAALRIDPYLLVSLQRALLAALRTLDNADEVRARRELRIQLEQLRQVYRDLADARPIYEDRPAKDLARWLARAVDVPQGRLAELFAVSPRTFQRWVSEADEAEPQGDDARRVRVVANLVSHLRHALTGRGVIGWFERIHPMAGGRRPLDLVDEPDGLTQLTRLAASTRSQLGA